MKNKLKSLIATVTATMMLLSIVPLKKPGAEVSQNVVTASASKKLMVGYWHNFDNNSKNIKLKDVNDNWDVINVSFGETDPTKDKSTIIFKPDPVIETEAEFISDVKYLQGKGKKVVLSIGGMYGQVLLSTTADKDKFVNSMIGLIDKYGFDGLDIDLEHHMDVADDYKNPKLGQNINLIQACKDLKAKYGDKFMLTMSPETAYVQGRMMSGSGGYLPLIYGVKDILNYISVQLYNSGGMNANDGNSYQQGTPDFVVSMCEMLLNGFEVGWGSKNMFPALREDQVLIGVPATTQAAGGGFVNNADMTKAIEALTTGKTYGGRYVMQNKSGYPNFGGVMSWSVNWDAVGGYSFSTNARKALDAAPVVTNTLQAGVITTTAPADKAYTVTATIPGRNTAISYEIFENGTSIQKGTLVAGQSAPQTKTVNISNKADGTYKYTVVVKDAASSLTSQEVAVTLSNGSGTGGGGTTTEKPLGVKEAMPIGKKQLVVGFWQNFGDNGPNVKFQTLAETDKRYDVLNVSFGEAPGTGCDVGFEPIYSEAQFIQDIKNLHKEGRRVCLSIGGQNGAIYLTDASKKDRFVKSVCEVIDKYGFDGLDIDVETGISMNGADDLDNPTTPSIVYMIQALNEITDRYGSNFILSMAPQNTDVQGGAGNNYGQNWGCYLPMINKLRDKLTYLTPQYYNNGTDVTLDGNRYPLGSADNLVGSSEMLLKGFYVGSGTKEQFFKPLRPDQVLVGVPACEGAAPAGGTIEGTEVAKALKYLIEGTSFGGQYKLQGGKYPTFRGAMTWSTNWDASKGYKFAGPVAQYLHSLKPVENTLMPAVLSNTDYVTDSFTVKAIIPGGNLATSYKLYEGTTVIDSGSLTAGDADKVISKALTGKTASSYTYKMVLTGANGVSVESLLTVNKQVAPPAKPDVNGDGVVDAADLALVAAKYNAVSGTAAYDAKCDMNGDGIIDIYDLTKVSKSISDQPLTNSWKTNTAYKLGDKVTYNGKTYECTFAHTSNDAWTPTAAFTLWKEV